MSEDARGERRLMPAALNDEAFWDLRGRLGLGSGWRGARQYTARRGRGRVSSARAVGQAGGFQINWLRVLDPAERSQVDQRIRQ